MVGGVLNVCHSQHESVVWGHWMYCVTDLEDLQQTRRHPAVVRHSLHFICDSEATKAFI